MSFFDLLQVLLEESSLAEALLVFVATAWLYWSLFGRRLRSLFDPLAYVLALSAMSSTFLVLSTLHGAISVEKFAFVAATLAGFYGGFLAVDSSARRRARVLRGVKMPVVRSSTLAVLFCANFLVLGVTYVFFGIPLLLESRLAQFSDSGGFGVLGRLGVGLQFGTLVLATIALRQSEESARGWAKLVFIQFLVSAVLSGSKSSLLEGLFAWALSTVFFTRSWSSTGKLPREMVAFLALAMVTPLFVIAIQAAGDAGGLTGTVQSLAVRVAAEGDGYAYFLGNDLIDSTARPDWLAPLRQVLVAFRVAAPETSVNPGFEIIGEIFGIDSPATGPNSRLPIYLLYFYGYSGLFLAPLLGMALGWARNRVSRMGQRSPTQFAMAAAVYLYFCRLEVDPQLTVSGLFGLALTLPIFWVAAAVARGRKTSAIRFASGPRVMAADGTSQFQAHS